MADPFDRLLERTMKAGASAPEACPSPEDMAAYVDGSLSLSERHAIERHAADCHTCAEHLALLSSLEPVSSGVADTAKTTWWRTWTWVVPVAASLVVAAVWVSLPREAQMPSTEVDRVSTAAPSPPAPQRSAATPAAAAAAPASAGSVAETKAAPASSALGGIAPKERTPTVPARSARVPLQAAPEVVGQRLDRPPQILAQTAPPPPADSSALKPQSADLKDKADEEQRQRAEAANTAAREGVASATSAPAAPASALPATRGPKSEAAFALRKQTAGAGIGNKAEMWDASGNGWRIASGVIERTSDRGATWQDAHAPALPGASMLLQISADVCWFGAPSGEVLLHASDGTWKRSRIPATTALTSLTATSATDAIATTEDERRFETKDAGVTWVLLPK